MLGWFCGTHAQRRAEDLVSRRRADVRDALTKVERVKRRVRITVTNTHARQPTSPQEGSNEVCHEVTKGAASQECTMPQTTQSHTCICSRICWGVELSGKLMPPPMGMGRTPPVCHISLCFPYCKPSPHSNLLTSCLSLHCVCADV